MSTILVVDDESNMRFLLRITLEAAGYEVVEAPHGAAALVQAREAPPDLVVTDLMMPVMGGRELIAELRANPQTASIPVLVITANPRTALDTADAVVGKPFAPDELVAAARSLAEREAV